ncbi:hypothetical protein [Specibacter cremeus]|uniref:hypothetical protein n=1 Tax=Specibacter cremeus TaxID=1629051 RepID=UPI000F7A22D0|nr:hypothetical protein [Specibacter cremeus]
MDAQVPPVLACTFERWDRKGLPDGRSGTGIPLEMRVTHLADVSEIYVRNGGVDAARTVVRQRRGTQFDPDFADLFCEDAQALTDGLVSVDSWTAALASAPPDAPLAGPELLGSRCRRRNCWAVDVENPAQSGRNEHLLPTRSQTSSYCPLVCRSSCPTPVGVPVPRTVAGGRTVMAAAAGWKRGGRSFLAR